MKRPLIVLISFLVSINNIHSEDVPKPIGEIASIIENIDNEELYKILMLDLERMYMENEYETMYFLDTFEYFTLYYDYLYLLSQLCIEILEENNLEMIEDRLFSKKEELLSNEYVKKMNGYNMEIEKAKQSEIYTIIEQILMQFIENNNEYNYEYYKDKINSIFGYLKDVKY
jgi:hypothetical protein